MTNTNEIRKEIYIWFASHTWCDTGMVDIYTDQIMQLLAKHEEDTIKDLLTDINNARSVANPYQREILIEEIERKYLTKNEK